jgi:hypothetical protein
LFDVVDYRADVFLEFVFDGGGADEVKTMFDLFRDFVNESLAVVDGADCFVVLCVPVLVFTG